MIIWKKDPKPYFMESECGQYRVSMCKGNNPDTYRYCGWHRQYAIWVDDDLEVVKRECNKHKQTEGK